MTKTGVKIPSFDIAGITCSVSELRDLVFLLLTGNIPECFTYRTYVHLLSVGSHVIYIMKYQVL